MKALNVANDRRLLLTSCSAKKHRGNGLRAIDRYDGPAFKIIRKYADPNLNVLILSAKYGLVHADDIIPWYEQKMTLQNAVKIRLDTTTKLQAILLNGNYDSMLVNLGKVYLEAVDWETLGYKGTIIQTEGPIGVRLHQLKCWVNMESEGSEI